ncbi:hypothetical protein STIAU_2469 [Stigmatella aurantiaca DW4/3-1]|uniref:Uncharacterized protein n=1 Tax=Stigmatella aurantiaca (strain DW4/3-1) TaxID=378806 RepID=Q08TH5_STIAD|nr:hypothetical protein STIAU_2469 [Stigmatella aurantiaca DW4/3-1]
MAHPSAHGRPSGQAVWHPEPCIFFTPPAGQRLRRRGLDTTTPRPEPNEGFQSGALDQRRRGLTARGLVLGAQRDLHARPHVDDGVVVARDGALDEQQPLLRVHVDDGQVLRRHLLHTVVARHLLVRVGAARRLTLTDGARVTLILVRTVGLRLGALEAPAPHDAREAAALRGARHVHQLPLGEQVRLHGVAHVELRRILRRHPELLQVTAQGRAVLLEEAPLGLVEDLLTDLSEAQRHRRVLVLLRRPLAHHLAGADVNDRHRNEVALVVEHLGHADLLANQTLHVILTASASPRRKLNEITCLARFYVYGQQEAAQSSRHASHVKHRGSITASLGAIQPGVERRELRVREALSIHLLAQQEQRLIQVILRRLSLLLLLGDRLVDVRHRLLVRLLALLGLVHHLQQALVGQDARGARLARDGGQGVVEIVLQRLDLADEPHLHEPVLLQVLPRDVDQLGVLARHLHVGDLRLELLQALGGVAHLGALARQRLAHVLDLALDGIHRALPLLHHGLMLELLRLLPGEEVLVGRLLVVHLLLAGGERVTADDQRLLGAVHPLHGPRAIGLARQQISREIPELKDEIVVALRLRHGRVLRPRRGGCQPRETGRGRATVRRGRRWLPGPGRSPPPAPTVPGSGPAPRCG